MRTLGFSPDVDHIEVSVKRVQVKAPRRFYAFMSRASQLHLQKCLWRIQLL